MREHLITPEQCRGARGMLELSQSDLADIVGLSRRAILEFERGARVPFLRNREQIKAALEAAGVEFLPDNAVRLKAK